MMREPDCGLKVVWPCLWLFEILLLQDASNQLGNTTVKWVACLLQKPLSEQRHPSKGMFFEKSKIRVFGRAARIGLCRNRALGRLDDSRSEGGKVLKQFELGGNMI